MAKSLFASVAFIMLTIAVNAQVDTLHLVRIAGIQTPQPIWGFSIEDIDGDSIKDFITCSEDHIHIINGADYSPYWSSPALSMPEKFQFADLDRDGIQEIIVKCGTNIKVLKPPVQFEYWTSPTLDFTYIDFSVGDRNGDLLSDIVIVRKEPFQRSGIRSNFDTVWVETYDGPNFDLEQTKILRLPNYDYYSDLMETRYTHMEYPTKVIIDNFTSDSSETHLLLFSNLDESSIWHGFYDSWSESGYVKVLRGYDLGIARTESQGRNYAARPVFIDGNSYFVSLSSNSSGVLTLDNVERYDEADYYRGGAKVRVDSLSYYFGATEAFKMAGALIDEFNSGHAGLELSFGGMINSEFSNQLIQNSIATGERIWQRNFDAGIDTILFKYSGPPFNHPQIVLMLENDSYYRFYNGITGYLTAVYNPEYYYISRIIDLNNDGIDEIISTANDSLCIFTLARTGIEDDIVNTPSQFKIGSYPNPFNGSVNIEYTLSKDSAIEIDIFNLTGQQINHFSVPHQETGLHQYQWDANNLTSGIYYCRIKADRERGIIKLILEK